MHYDIFVISKATGQELYSAKGYKKLAKAKQTANSLQESFYFGEKSDVYVHCNDSKGELKEVVYHFELKE